MSVCQSPVRAHLLSDTILINYRELPPPRGAGPSPAGGASSPAEPSLSPHPSARSCPGGAGLLPVLTLKERAARAALAKCGGRRQATRCHGCLWLSAPAVPPGSRGGADEASPCPAEVLGARGPGSLRSWQLAGFISASSPSSMLAFPLFCFPGSPMGAGKPAAPQHLRGPRSPLVPICLFCDGAGEREKGTAFSETPLRFFYHSPCGRGWQSWSHPPRPSQGIRKTLENPMLPQSRQTLLFSRLWWHTAGAVLGDAAICTTPSSQGMPRARAELRARCCGARHGAASGPLPHTQCPQPRAEGDRLRVK